MNFIISKFKKIIRETIPNQLLLDLLYFYTCAHARMLEISVSACAEYYKISKELSEIRLSKNQAIYIKDIVDHFDFYYGGVEPEKVGGINLVDYSKPNYHHVKGFDYFKIMFPSVAEPIVTTRQYIEFAQLSENSVVIDLGAYSGLTSILFDMEIKKGGRVIAVEADQKNIPSCKTNFEEYQKRSGRSIDFVQAAIWKDCGGVSFSSEGNMGSSASDIVGSGRGDLFQMPSITLTKIAQDFDLSRVDFIKCDIEGGEIEIFKQDDFFAKYSPKIMIECHLVDGVMTSAACKNILGKYGYNFRLVTQDGYPLPLLECWRS